MLIRDIAASLPAELATRIEAAPSVEEVHNWIAAGAVYRWVDSGPPLAHIFLAEVADSPKRAGLVLAKTLAARMEPPPRGARWHRRDHIGLVFQLAVVCAILVCRGLFFNPLGHYGGSPLFQSWLAALLCGVVGLLLLSGEMSGSLLAVALLGCAALRLGFVEAFVAATASEEFVPITRAPGQPAASSVVAHGHFLRVSAQGWVRLAQIALSAAASGGQRAIAVAVGRLLMAIIWPVVASVRSTFKLGTDTARQSIL